MLRSAPLKAMLGGILGTAALAAVLPAQDTTATAAAPQAGTYVVREGDTLWDIAKALLGDPFLWPEIYRLNTDVVEDPHWIYPGEVLRTAAAAPVVAGAPAPEPVAPPRMTVFSGDSVRRISQDPRLLTSRGYQGPTVRPGEFLAAPYVDRVGGPAELGRISFLGDVTRVPRERTTEYTAVQLGDVVTLEMKQPAAAGTRYLAFALGDVLRDRSLNEVGQLVIPVGVIRVERSGAAGQPVTARLTQQYQRVLLDQGLILMPAPPADSIRPVAVSSSASFATLQVVNEPALTTLASYVIIDATSKDRLRPGDRVGFFRPPSELEGGQVVAETEIARGQVIRVTPQATTVILVGETYSDLGAGTRAKLIAKMP